MMRRHWGGGSPAQIGGLLTATFLTSFGGAACNQPLDNGAGGDLIRVAVARSAPMGVRATSSPSNPSLYGGGPLLSPEVDAVFWGTFTSGQIAAMQTYLSALAMHMRGASAPAGQEPATFQYGVYGATIGASWTDTTLPTHNGLSGHAVGSQVTSEIATLQSQNHIPAYSPERLVMVFTNGITFDDDYCGNPGSDTNCYCGYHSSAGTNEWFSLNPFPSTASCGSTGFGSWTSTDLWKSQTSHEVFEASTDPDLSTGWIDAANAEIGDPCNWGNDPTNTVSVAGVGPVQLVVDNLQTACSIYTKQQLPQTSVASWGTGRMDAFALDADRTAGHIAFSSTGGWSSWESHGGGFIGQPVVTSWGANELDVFGQGMDGAYYHQHWTGSAWQPTMTTWEGHGGNFIGAPTVVSWAANRLDVFGVGTDGALYHQAFDGTTWLPSQTTWENLGGTLVGRPAVTSWGANRIDIVAKGMNGAYMHKDWNGSAWEPSFTGWEGHAGVFIGPPVMTSPAANVLDVFGQATDGSYVHQRYNGTSWQPSLTTWEGHGGVFIGPPAAISWGSNTLDLYGQGTDGSYYHQHFDGTNWQPSVSAWDAHGGSFVSGPALGTWGTNTVAAFGTSASGGTLLLQDWQGFWSPSETTWTSLGGSIH